MTVVPNFDATHGNPAIATLTVDEFTLHALTACAMTTAQSPRLADELLRLLSEAERKFATDAGHWCRECGHVVSWLDHLPPAAAGEPVRCFTARLDEALSEIA